MPENINIPSLMRQAREAISQKNFEDAAAVYELILQDPDMMDLLDIKARYAFCIEEAGNIPKAIELYQEIVGIYRETGETGAAKALELKISILNKLSAKPSPSSAQKKPKKAASKQPSAPKPDIKAAPEEPDFLSLDTQDLTPLEDLEATQELSPTEAPDPDPMEITRLINTNTTQDTPESDIEHTQAKPTPDSMTDTVKIQLKPVDDQKPPVLELELEESAADLAAMMEKKLQDNAEKLFGAARLKAKFGSPASRPNNHRPKRK